MSSAVLAIYNETVKGFRLMWSYLFNTVTQWMIMAMIFVGIGFLMGNGEFHADQLAPTLLGYLIWFYAMVALTDMSIGLMQEAQAGTLEQMYLSPTPIGVVLIGRVLADFLTTTLQVIVVGTAMALTLGIYIPIRLDGLPVFLLTIAGVFGLGFVMAGSALVFKQVGALANLLQYILLFLNGAMVPIDRLPTWMQVLAQLLPSTQGIIVLRRIMLEGVSFVTVCLDGSMLLLLLNTFIYLLGGWLIFQWCDRIARRRGSVGQY